ncbi:MAG: hypothetical protein ACTHM6_09870 [Tepidisphaeraceae bacterium]
MLTANVNIPKAVGHALLVGSDGCRSQPRLTLSASGYEIDECDDPYAALLELCRRPLVYRAVVLSLQCLYPEELSIISTIRRRFPHVSIWLSQTDGRQAFLAEAMRLGAEALIDQGGVHTLLDPHHGPANAKPMTFRPVPSHEGDNAEPAARARAAEPVLSAEELRALLGDGCV